MKKIFKTVAFLLASAYAFAQAPQSFNYQGLARDNSGTAMAAKTISVKATILDGTTTGTSVYSETFSVSTNAFGLFTLGIGSGSPVTGTFSAIKWSTGNKFLKIEIDPNGGSSYALSGTTQLLSVPYAMYAASAGDSKWTDATGGINYSGGKVGIGTSTPISALSIKGDFTGDDRALISLNNTSTAASAAAGIVINSINEGTGLYVYSSNYYPNLLPWQTGRTVLGSSAKNGIRFDAGNKPTSNIEFALGPDIAISGETKRPLRMIISNSGNVGIGTETPSAILHTNGSVRLQGLTSNNTLTNALVTDANGNVFTKDISTLSKTPKLTVSSIGDTLYSGEKSNWVIIPGISAVNKPTVTDADGNTYEVVKIGTQTWMAENLRTTKYNDGTPITTFSGADLAGPWFANTTGAYTYSSEDMSNRIPYGALYNLFAAKSNKICPTDWHVATTADWTTMIDLLGGNDIAAEKLKQTGTINWLSPNVATNSSGFNAVGGGQKFDGTNTYQHFKEFAEFWRPDGTLLYFTNTGKNIITSSPAPQYGFSIRCVKN